MRPFIFSAAMATFACAAPDSTGGGSEPPAIAIDERAAGSTLSVHPGQRLTVSLPGNPGTGFSWELLPGAEPVLELQGEPGFTRGGRAPGAGGSYTFAFRGASPGKVLLIFSYHRSFEPGVASAKTFQVTVTVR